MAGPKKWYINLFVGDNRDNNQMATGSAKNRGPAIPFTAKRKFGHTLRKKGNRTVVWNVDWDKKEHDEWTAPGDAPKMRHAETLEQNGKFENKLDVPPIGGRTYTVTASKKGGEGANNVAFSSQILAWRRLYYTVYSMNSSTKALFGRIENNLKDAFAEACIELKRRGMKSTHLDEQVTIQEYNDAVQKRLAPMTLDRSPFHLRLVLVNDVASHKDKTFTWQMDKTIDTDDVKYGDGKVTVKTHSETTQLVREHKLTELTVIPQGVTIDVPSECIRVNNPERKFEIDLNAHDDVRSLRDRPSYQKELLFKAKLRGKKVDQGFDTRTDNVSEAVTRAHTAEAKKTSGVLSLWLAGDTIHLEVDDGDWVLTQKGARFAKARFAQDSEWVDAVRASDTRLSFDISGKQTLTGELDKVNGTVTVELELLLERPKSPPQPAADHNLELKLSTGRVSVGGLTYANKAGYRLEFVLDGFIPVGNTPLTEVKIVPDLDHVKLDNALKDDHDQIVQFSEDAKSFVIDFDYDGLQDAKVALGADRKVDVEAKMTYTASLGGYNVSGTPTCILTCIKLEDDTEEKRAKRLMCVLMHEIGHALGLVRRNETKGDANVVDNDRWYTDEYGGRGDHCHMNGKLERNDETSSGQVYVWDTGPLCIMFHTVKYVDKMNGKFCDRCIEHLLRNEVKPA